MIISKPGRFGDLKSFEVKCDDKDITEAVLEVHVFQDVFTPTWSAQFFMNDTGNLLMSVPIKPGSMISVKIETDNQSPTDGEKTFEFVVYRIGDKSFTNAHQQTYTLFCASEAFLRNSGTRVSKSFNNKKATEIADTIVKEFLGGKLDMIPCDDKIHVIIPNWTPFNSIAWLTKHAMKDNAADYMFFQRDNDEYVMKPMEKLYDSDEESTEVTFFQKPSEMRGASGEYDTDYSLAITRYEVEHYDAAANMASGYYANKKLSYDLISKKWEEKTFRYGDDCKEDGEKKSWTDGSILEQPDSNITFVPKHPGMADKPSYLDKQDSWEPSRKSSIQKLDQEKIVIQLPGGAKTHEWVGKNCEIDLPSQQDLEPTEKLDEYRKGKYIIIAICHVISRETYSVNIECVKKRLDKKLEDGG